MRGERCNGCLTVAARKRWWTILTAHLATINTCRFATYDSQKFHAQIRHSMMCKSITLFRRDLLHCKSCLDTEVDVVANF